MTRSSIKSWVLALVGGSLVVLAGCGKSSPEMALVLVNVQADGTVPTFTRLRFSVTDRTGLPTRTVPDAPRSLQFGYYLPGVNGDVTVKGQAISADGCVVGEGSVTVTGVRVGAATDGGTLLLLVLGQPICGIDAGAEDAADDGAPGGTGGGGRGGSGGQGANNGSGGMGAGGTGGTGGAGTAGRGSGGTGTGGGSGGVGGGPGTGGSAGSGGRPGTGGMGTGGMATGGRSTGGMGTGGMGTGGMGTGGVGTGGMGTGGVGTGGMGTGGAGTGGSLPTAAGLFPAGTDGSLDGRLVTIPCADANVSGDDCTSGGAYYRGTLTACSGGSLNVLHTYPVAGAPGVTYRVTMHFYGILSPRNYGASVTRDASPGRPGQQDSGAIPSPWATAPANYTYPASTYDTHEIHVDDQNNQEVAVYFLNADTSEGHWSYVINFEKQISVIGGGRIRVRTYDQNCRIIKNCGANSTVPCTAKANARIIDVSAANPAPANAAADLGGLLQPHLITTRDANSAGEWTLIDVVSVDSMMP